MIAYTVLVSFGMRTVSFLERLFSPGIGSYAANLTEVKTRMPNAKVLSEKQAIVASLTEKLQGAAAGIIVDYKGITVAEDTPLSYKLHFQTSEQELTTPNLFAPFTEYHVDLSAADSTLNIPLKDLILTYQRASASALRISIAPKNTAAPVLVDLHRTTIYDGSTIETQTFNGSSISASIAIDGTVYTNSQETHNMRIRQQDPVTKL